MIVWIIFIAAILLFLALDLGVFNKTPHIISSKEAGMWTGIWVLTSVFFSFVVYWIYKNGLNDNPTNLTAGAAFIKYITGYLIELSLSVDNIFVIAVIFNSFKIPHKYQHRVLFWGILGAIVFRGLMIYFGVLLINKFSWMTYIFGVFLIFTAFRMLISDDEKEFKPKKSFVYRNLKKIIPVTSKIDGEHFFVKKKRFTAATPLFVALIVIEVMDVIFALDSVPAILAITADPFLVFSSNIFAILGLRSMYFFLANMLEKFSYLEYSLIAILFFIGLKMLFLPILEQFHVEIPEWMSLGFIAVSITTGILISLKKNKETNT
jgi:tellurite resistance protein TerC